MFVATGLCHGRRAVQHATRNASESRGGRIGSNSVYWQEGEPLQTPATLGTRLKAISDPWFCEDVPGRGLIDFQLFAQMPDAYP
jgi:hypothetical protein